MEAMRSLRVLVCGFGLAEAALGQCGLHWESAGSYPGANAPVRASALWDADGPGPAPAMPVLCGDFTLFANTIASRIVVQDPSGTAWLPLGSGVGGSVRAVLPLPNGHLIAAGSFALAGGIPAANIARWDGVQWLPLGSGVNGTVHALVLMPNGDIVAGGGFSTAGGGAAAYAARWDGAAWHPLASGPYGVVYAMTVGLSGVLHVVGEFSEVAAFASGTWVTVGGGFGVPRLTAICTLPNGDLFAAGQAIAWRWNGTVWLDMHLPSFDRIDCARVGPTGDLWCGGGANGASWPQLLRWRVWTGCVVVSPPSPTGGMQPGIQSVLPLPNGDVLVGGVFTEWIPYGTATHSGALLNVFRWNGTQPVALGRGFGGRVDGLSRGLGGDILACGAFAASGEADRPGLARYAGGEWSWAGAAPMTNTWSMYALFGEMATATEPLANGNLVVAGMFRGVVGQSQFAFQAAVVTPTTSTLLLGPYPLGYFGGYWPARAMVRRRSGEVLVAGSEIHVLSPSGVVMGQYHPPSVTTDMSLANDGSLLIAHTGNRVSLGDGVSWTTLGPAFNAPVWCVRDTRLHGMVAGGAFSLVGGAPVDHIARWDGAVWRPLGLGLNGQVRKVLELPNGDLLVGGDFTAAGSVSLDHLARWDGTSWTAVAGGTNAPVSALLLAEDGTIWVGGEFSVAGTMGCGFIARLVPDCAAAAVSFGTGCVGSGGLNTLAALSLPWLGSTFSSQAGGMPSNGLAVAVNGQASWLIPLPLILPIGLAGCDLRVVPEVMDLCLPVAGTVSMHLPLPVATVLLGQSLYQQVVPIELDAAGNLSALTATNALQLTVGAL